MTSSKTREPAGVEVRLERRFARELPELAVPWQAEEAPGPAAARAQRAAGRRARPRPRLAAQPRRRSACWSAPPSPTAPPRSRRPTPGTSSAATPRGSATAARCCSASSSTPTGAVRDLHLKGSGRTPFARGGDGLAAVGPMLREYVVSEAMHALGIPTTRSLAVVATGRPVQPRDAAARRRARPGGEQPPARRQLPVRPRHRRPRPAAPPRRPRDRPAPPRRRRGRAPLPRAVRGGRRRPGGAGRPVDARRLHPRRHEHRQHDDLRRDHRLRAVRLHGRLRPGHGLQLHRPRRPLRLRQPAGRSPSGTSPGSPRPCSRCSHDDQEQAVALAVEALGGFRAPVRRRLVGRACAPSSACPATLAADVRPAAGRRPARPAAGRPRRPHVVLPRASAAAARGDAEPARGLFLDLAGVRRLAGALARPGPGRRARWTASTRSTSRATTSSRRPWPPRPTATSTRRAAAGGGDRAVRRAARPRAVRRARPAATSAPTGPSAAPDSVSSGPTAGALAVPSGRYMPTKVIARHAEFASNVSPGSDAGLFPGRDTWDCYGIPFTAICRKRAARRKC